VAPVHAAKPLSPSGRPAHLPSPALLAALAQPLLGWKRRHVLRVARRYYASLDDLWDEATTALLRAAVYYKPAAGPFAPYARTAVHRACWRYVIRGHDNRPVAIPLEDAHLAASPSAEDEAIGREAAHRAWILRQHAALAAARHDEDATSRLRDAASAAATVARTQRRRPRARA